MSPLIEVGKPCLRDGSCPYGEDTKHTQQDTTHKCNQSGYDCPIYQIQESINESRIPEGLDFPGAQWLRRGDDLQLLAASGVETLTNYLRAREAYQTALTKGLEKGTETYAETLLKRGDVSLFLANEGDEPTRNYNEAINLYQQARSEGLVAGTVKYARSFEHEATARYHLADIDNPMANYTSALELYREANKNGYQPGTESYAITLQAQASTLYNLARLNVNTEEYFQETTTFLERSLKEGLHPGTALYMVSLSLKESVQESRNKSL